MRKMIVVVATGLLSVALAAGVAGAAPMTLASPSGAAVGSSPSVMRHDRGPSAHECYGHRRPHRGDCYDEHRPQHDGRGSILF
jgi:hypothetical protein